MPRKATESERSFFKKNPNVSGYAAPDNQVVLNPFSKLSKKEKKSVLLNENVRIGIRTGKIKKPEFQITHEQIKRFGSYSRNIDDIRATIAARIASGDPSAGKATDEQKKYVKDQIK
jgi:hypothetical protein